MSNLISIYDHQTGENVVREMTADEIAERENEIAIFTANKEARKQEQAQKEAAKAEAEAKLAALGLTPADLRALGL